MCPYHHPEDQDGRHHPDKRWSLGTDRVQSREKRSCVQRPEAELDAAADEGMDPFRRNYQNITFHSYRRTYATLQAAAGTDIRTIQSNMAHKSITTTQRYMKVVDSNKREATTKITLTRKGWPDWFVPVLSVRVWFFAENHTLTIFFLNSWLISRHYLQLSETGYLFLSYHNSK